MGLINELFEAHANRGTKLTVRTISIDRNEPNEISPSPIENFVLIEGDRDSLRFLGQFLIAFAEGDFGCSYNLHPLGAGSAHLLKGPI